MTPFSSPAVAAVYAGLPDGARAGITALRGLIYQEAANLDVGPLSETLKWGQPSYVPQRARVGTPLRLGCPKEGGFAIYAHCQTTVIQEFRDMFGDRYRFDGTRAVLFDATDTPGTDLHLLIRRALTYHRG